MATYNLMTNTRRLFFELAFVLHSYYILSFQLWVFLSSHHMGSFPACNSSAIVFVFVPIPILDTGRLIFIVITSSMLFISTLLIGLDISKTVRSHFIPSDNENSTVPSQTEPLNSSINSLRSWQPFDFSPLQLCLFILYLINSVFSITFTELTISHATFTNDSSAPVWSFGQVLPLFLLILPISNFLKSSLLLLRLYYFSRLRGQVSPVISLTVIQN